MGQKIEDFFEGIYCRKEPETEFLKRDELFGHWKGHVMLDRLHEFGERQYKPNLDCLSKITNQFNPDKIIVVGDSLFGDRLTAKLSPGATFAHINLEKNVEQRFFKLISKIGGFPHKEKTRRDRIKDLVEKIEEQLTPDYTITENFRELTFYLKTKLTSMDIDRKVAYATETLREALHTETCSSQVKSVGRQSL